MNGVIATDIVVNDECYFVAFGWLRGVEAVFFCCCWH